MSVKSFITMITAADKRLHFKGGLALLAGAVVVIFLSLMIGLHPVTAIILGFGISGAGSVEGTQWNDNKNEVAAGNPPRHEVSFWDFFVTTIPCDLVAISFEILYRRGTVPSWDQMILALASVAAGGSPVPTP